MANLLVSGIGSALAGGPTAANAAPLPLAADRGVPSPPSSRNQATGSMQRARDGSGADTLAAAPDKGAASAAEPGASAASQAIGTQLVLVFDDQTRSMTVKILDIRTQKVDQQTGGEAQASEPQPTGSAAAGSGMLVDTRA